MGAMGIRRPDGVRPICQPHGAGSHRRQPCSDIAPMGRSYARDQAWRMGGCGHIPDN